MRRLPFAGTSPLGDGRAGLAARNELWHQIFDIGGKPGDFDQPVAVAVAVMQTAISAEVNTP